MVSVNRGSDCSRKNMFNVHLAQDCCFKTDLKLVNPSFKNVQYENA